MCKILDIVEPGVLNAEESKTIFALAKKHNFAIPAINCINTDSINTVLESASIMKSPIIIQFSYGGSIFMSGSGLKKKLHDRAIIGAISGAQYTHHIAKYYDVPVILHTDHCDLEHLPWINGLLLEGKKTFKQTGRPLFSSHMIDLSKEDIKKNLFLSVKYLKKVTKLDMMLEIELGCTGGEEDGINNSNIDNELLYTDTKDILYAFNKLSKINNNFIIAAAFGNVHGVYQPGKVALRPSILKNAQKYISSIKKLPDNPINFVFHGGSGTNISHITKSINYGVVKFNIDTDMQWNYWKGVLDFYIRNKPFLQHQLENSLKTNQPNKKYYDPRAWIRHAQQSSIKYLNKMCINLNSYNKL
ncbi:class II fructose-bisphosphate aldolase [Buchnera aphidicola]|uniref:class II fructose-bisphosphate aldolase n=1 Tax=Buchnera aphidicola TaxID=9 RepID=UPI00094CBFD5|nr:class II fructose-bisphosphate aldolase [Buchnera aphidicola]